MTDSEMKNSTYGPLETRTECRRFVCVCSCTSGDGSYTKKFSRTWFSQHAHWVSLLTLHSTRRRMFSLCDSDSASQLFLLLSPTSPPPRLLLCATISPHPCPLPPPRFYSQWHHGRLKSRLFKEARSFSNSLITWHSVPASWLCRYSHSSVIPVH